MQLLAQCGGRPAEPHFGLQHARSVDAGAGRLDTRPRPLTPIGAAEALCWSAVRQLRGFLS
jgi:hypothetical protein